MTTAESKAIDEGQIRALIENRVKAVRAKEIDGVMSNVAPDILSFDVLDPLRHAGSGAVRERAEAWFSLHQGPIGYEIRDLSITAGDVVAFGHYLYRVTGTRRDGGTVDMWVRATDCYRKLDGMWMVTHQHQSVPFDAASGRASLDLKP